MVCVMTNTERVKNARILHWEFVYYNEDGDNVIATYDFLNEHYRGVGVSKELALENMCSSIATPKYKCYN